MARNVRFVLISAVILALAVLQIKSIDIKCTVTNTGSVSPTCFINESIVLFDWEKINFILPRGLSPRKIERVEFNESTAWRAEIFPVQIFETFLNLKKLKLKVEIDKKTIRQEDFVDATELNELVLTDGHLDTIPSRVFHTVLGLTVVVLRNNDIHTIEDFAFDNLEELQVLSLSENAIRNISRWTFGSLPSLRALYLRQNHIESIEDGALDMPNLKLLSLNQNALVAFSDSLFKATPQLSVLLADSNIIQIVQKSLYGLQELRKLFLSNNPITDLNIVELAKLPKLEYLLLRNANFNLDWVNVTDADINSTTSAVKILDLSGNGMRSRDVFRKLKLFKQLQALNLASNNLSLLDLELKEPPLKVIKLDNNVSFNWDQIRSILKTLNMQFESSYIVEPGSSFDFDQLTANLREDNVLYL